MCNYFVHTFLWCKCAHGEGELCVTILLKLVQYIFTMHKSNIRVTWLAETGILMGDNVSRL